MLKKLSLLLTLSLALSAATQPVIIARGQTRQDSASQAELNKQSGVITRIFSSAGIPVTELKDSELTDAALKGGKLIIFPYNAPLTDPCYNAVKSFTDKGGKIMLFYSSDQRLHQLVGLQPPKFLGREAFGTPISIHFETKACPGLPEKLHQPSWNGMSLTPAAKNGATVLGVYQDAAGKNTGHNAVTKHANGFAFSHILQNLRPAETQQTILTLAATAVPDFWKTPAENVLSSLGTIGGCANLPELTELIRTIAPQKTHPQLDEANKLANDARTAVKNKKYRTAYDLACQARVKSRLAYLLAIPPRANELRGVWIHNAYGLNDWGWDKTVKVLKDNGFNAIFPNMLWGYVADYPSTVLPVYPAVAKRGDQLKLCSDACRKYGVELHVWKVCWNMSTKTPEPLRKKMIDAKRVQITSAGTTSHFLAAHLKENQDLEVNAFLEIIRKYDVDGIHLDYIRYPEQDCDYSPSARETFEKHLGKKVPKWPDDCMPGGRLRRTFNIWRRGNIDRTVERISREAHALKPSIKVSAAVFGGWDGTQESIAQHAEKWIHNGWLDFVCPMDYTPDRTYFTQLVERQVEGNANKIPLYIGIGSYMHSDAATTAEQIDLTRRLGADGFICFQETLTFAERDLPELHLNPTRTYDTPPFAHHSPAVSFASSRSKTPQLDQAYAFPEPVTVTATFPADFKFPKGTCARLLRDGYYLPVQPSIQATGNGSKVTCTFLPPQPGVYRLEISDNKTFINRSQNLPVLTPEEVRQKLIAEGVPQFAKNGKPRVAIWQYDAYGTAAITKSLTDTQAFDIAPLLNLKPDTLAACDAVIIPQPRKNAALFMKPQTAQVLHDYIKKGGSVLVTHSLVGSRIFHLICPEITAYARELKTNQWKLGAKHPAAGKLPAAAQTSTFVDIVGIDPGPQGVPFLTAAKPSNNPEIPNAVGVAGSCGKGRYIAIGLGLGIAPGDKDCDLLPNEAALLKSMTDWLVNK